MVTECIVNFFRNSFMATKCIVKNDLKPSFIATEYLVKCVSWN